MLYRWEQDGAVLYRSPVFDAIGIPHGFGTRHADEDAIALALDLPRDGWVRVRQVHGCAVHVPPQEGQGDACDADAIVITEPGQTARIVTADCVPILLAAVDGSAVAAVHAGWRGLVAGVIERAVAAFKQAGAGGAFVAAVGPCMGVAHFEVGPEVAAQFDSAFVRRDLGPRPHVGLRAAATAILKQLGADEIDTTDRCTYADEADFFSHRRDVTHRGGRPGTLSGAPLGTGRMVSVVGLR